MLIKHCGIYILNIYTFPVGQCPVDAVHGNRTSHWNLTASLRCSDDTRAIAGWASAGLHLMINLMFHPNPKVIPDGDRPRRLQSARCLGIGGIGLQPGDLWIRHNSAFEPNPVFCETQWPWPTLFLPSWLSLVDSVMWFYAIFMNTS